MVSFWIFVLGWCHETGSLDQVKFDNFEMLKIEQNLTSLCSLPYIIYQSMLGFSYVSSFFIQIRLKTIFLAILLLENIAKYNKEIDMTVRFVLITFKKSCVIVFLKFFFVWVFKKSLYKNHFWLGRLLEEKIFPQSLIYTSDDRYWHGYWLVKHILPLLKTCSFGIDIWYWYW